MSTSYRTILITDPCYVNSIDNYQEYIAPTIKHKDIDKNNTVLRNYIPLKITKVLYNSLNKALLVPSATSDEEFYLFSHSNGDKSVEAISVDASNSIEKYVHVGTHHSDSEMTCIIDKNPFNLPCAQEGNDAKEVDGGMDEPLQAYEEVDWQDFALTTLTEEATQAPDRNSFPLYLWYGRIPNGGSAIQVHVKYNDDGVVDGIMLKADIDHDDDNHDN